MFPHAEEFWVLNAKCGNMCADLASVPLLPKTQNITINGDAAELAEWQRLLSFFHQMSDVCVLFAPLAVI